jgi:hypothetical protein
MQARRNDHLSRIAFLLRIFEGLLKREEYS